MGTITRSFANLIGANGPISLPSGVGGKVLQVVTGNTSTQVVNTTTTFADTTLTASITPASASNKILILISQNIQVWNSSSYASAVLQLLRNATEIYGGANDNIFHFDYGGSGLNLYFNHPLMILDSPNTTSSTTYKTRIKIGANGGSQANANYNNTTSFIQLLEISG